MPGAIYELVKNFFFGSLIVSSLIFATAPRLSFAYWKATSAPPISVVAVVLKLLTVAPLFGGPRCRTAEIVLGPPVKPEAGETCYCLAAGRF